MFYTNLDQFERELITWCDEHITNNVAEKLDKGELSGRDYFIRLAQQGFLSEFTDTAKALKLMLPLTRIVSSYSGALANALAVNLTGAMILATFGATKHKRIAQKILAGESSASFLLTEEFAGSDVGNMQTKSELQDNGNWLINGEKWFATGAQDADWLLVVARSQKDQPINKSTSIFCVSKDLPGIRIDPMNKIASLGFASCYVTLDNLQVSAADLVGTAHNAWQSIAFTGGLERLLVAASATGLSTRMLDYITQYSLERKVADQAIIDFQAINHQLVDAKTKLKAAELLVEDALAQMAKGLNATTDICMAKLYASEVQQDISSLAMRVLGGRAYLDDFPIARWNREGQLSLYAGGTNEVQKNIIARGLIKTADKAR